MTNTNNNLLINKQQLNKNQYNKQSNKKQYKQQLPKKYINLPSNFNLNNIYNIINQQLINNHTQSQNNFNQNYSLILPKIKLSYNLIPQIIYIKINNFNKNQKNNNYITISITNYNNNLYLNSNLYITNQLPQKLNINLLTNSFLQNQIYI